MVTLNLTIFVELGLFLVFMWLMHTFVFRPLLQVMDTRESDISDDRVHAKTAAAEAENLEKQFAQEVAAIHRRASQRVIEAHRQANETHNEQVESLRRKAEKELAEARASARAQVESERANYPEATAALVETMAAQVGLEELQGVGPEEPQS